MKAVHIVPGMDDPTCGIAVAAKQLIFTDNAGRQRGLPAARCQWGLPAAGFQRRLPDQSSMTVLLPPFISTASLPETLSLKLLSVSV